MKKRQSRTLALIVSLCMVFTLLPTAAFAAQENVAEIDGQGYPSLAEAFEAAQGNSTITVLKDAEIDSIITLDSGDSLTLDLGDHTVTTASKKFIGVQHGSPTIEGNGGTLKESSPYFAPVVMFGSTQSADAEGYSVVNVQEGVTLEGWAGVMMDRLAVGSSYGMELNVNGKLNGLNDGSNDGSGVYLNGQITATEGAPKVVIGSTAEVTGTGCGIYAAGYGEWTVEDGAYISGKTGIEIRAGHLTVNGGTIEGTGAVTESTPNSSGSTTAGAGIAVVQHVTNLDLEVTVKGGTVKGATALYENDIQDDDSDNITITVSGGNFVGTGENGKAVDVGSVTKFVQGGSFSNAISQDMGYLADGLNTELKKSSGDAKYSYYATLEEAQKAAEAGDELTDMSAVTTVTVTIKFADEDTADQVYHLAEGTQFTLPQAPVHEGYTFQGWSDATDTYAEGATYTVPGEDVTLTGQWLQDSTPDPRPGDPNANGVADLLEVENHIAFMQGDELENFRPDANVTRAEAAQMFYNLLKNKTVEGTASFTDVSGNAWYYEAVTTLANLGIVKGVGRDEFAPMRTISRGEFVVMAMRFANAVEADSHFTDVSEDYWAYAEINGAAHYGWLTGYTDGTFKPGQNMARSEAVAILCRMLDRQADQDYIDANADSLKLFADVDKDYWAYYLIVEATNTHEHNVENDVENWQ